MPFWMAVTLLQYGEWLTTNGRAADATPFLEEAREIFERLRATPWIERVGGPGAVRFAPASRVADTAEAIDVTGAAGAALPADAAAIAVDGDRPA